MKKIFEQIRQSFAAATDKNDEQMTLTIKNYILLIAGFVVIIIGMVLMTGGGSDDPNVFNYDMFSWRRITLAPILIVGGFAFEVYALLKKF
ncbi:MAG: DUF3098 domain-containing protein [Alistipes sp.]|nr:DUF3098 domain-containing protein [Alistipes sp.]